MPESPQLTLSNIRKSTELATVRKMIKQQVIDDFENIIIDGAGKKHIEEQKVQQNLFDMVQKYNEVAMQIKLRA
jgi:vacuolar-type H+-ATPase catalytic subunit A/Vma1